MKNIIYGALAAFFFSTTFVFNRAMSLEDGHWVWLGVLRYFYMLVILIVWLSYKYKPLILKDIITEFKNHFSFWLIAGTIGFGFFYAPLCYSASFAPGWVVAVTFMFTILANVVVLRGFGKIVPLSGVTFLIVIFIGIILVNLEQIQLTGIYIVLSGSLPVLISAFAFPFGNQLVGEALHGHKKYLPELKAEILKIAPVRVLLMTMGSLPFWIILIFLTEAPAPTSGQWIQTFIVALFSGVVATSIFLYARHRATSGAEIAVIDATQSLEIVFALFGEVIFLGGLWPGLSGIVGILLTVAGLILMTYFSRQNS